MKQVPRNTKKQSRFQLRHRSSTSADVLNEKGEMIMEGYINKRGKNKKSFDTRWFVLYDSNLLEYYQDPDGPITSKPNGSIDLYLATGIKENNKFKNTFNLFTPKRNFLLKVQDDTQYNRWINLLKIRIKPKILYKGWLYKKGDDKIRAKWKQRYFVLCQIKSIDYEIRYYEDENMTKYKGKIKGNKIKKIVIIQDLLAKKKYSKQKPFELITENRTYSC